MPILLTRKATLRSLIQAANLVKALFASLERSWFPAFIARPDETRLIISSLAVAVYVAYVSPADSHSFNPLSAAHQRQSEVIVHTTMIMNSLRMPDA